MTPSLINKQQYWQDIFTQFEQSQLTVTAFCKQHQLNTSTFYLWRKQLEAADIIPSNLQANLVPVTVIPEQHCVKHVSNKADNSAPPCVTISTPNGYQLSLPCELPLTLIQHYLQVLPL
ncbi:IS66 family insertion sequence element accessory protein TnpA [Shewanella sairae]|uniref:IS66 family insertion sequence element accessory protein TnpA n=1 Tax=Shewanella sairae TaxID=190310 RepID=UPI001C81A072|nr:hypothetical protein [Shewanella sairae]MCL1132379.1 hypothetical protein [Shewanella sairae]